jgi:hypothetical protein
MPIVELNREPATAPPEPAPPPQASAPAIPRPTTHGNIVELERQPSETLPESQGALQPGGFDPFRGQQFSGEELERIQSFQRFLEDPATQRAMVEAGVSIPAMFLAPQVGIPAAGARAISATRSMNLALRAGSAGAGMAVGSGLAETFDPSERPFKEAADAFFIGAAFELGAAGAIAVGRKAIAPLAGKLEKGAAEAIQTAREAGALVLPGQASTSRMLDLMQNVAEASLLGGGRLQQVTRKSADALQDTIENYAGVFAVTGKENVGDMMRMTIGESSLAFRAFVRALAKRVDDTAGGIQVDYRPVKAAAQEVIEQSEKGLRGEATIRIAKKILDKDDFVPFEDADILRSDLLAVERQSTDLMPAKAAAAAKRLAGLVDGQIDDAGSTLRRDDAVQAWRLRNSAVKEGKATFNSRFMRALTNKQPDEIYESVVKPGRPSRIRQTRQIILGEIEAAKSRGPFARDASGRPFVTADLPSNPELWKSVQGQWVDDMLRKAADEQGHISGSAALKQMKRFGDDAMKELFPGGEHENLRRYLRALEIVQKKPTQEGTGRVFIQLTQATAMVNLVVGGPLTGMSAAVLLAPPVLARAFTNPTIAKLLTVGLKAPPGSAEAIRVSSQLFAAFDKEGLLPPEISLLNLGRQARDFTKQQFGK